MAQKTNAARILDSLHIEYELRDFEVDTEDLSAAHAADLLGFDPAKIYKTLVLEGKPGGYFVAVIPSHLHLDLKKAAIASGNKKCDMIHMKDLKEVTGYIRGGCSPIGMKKQFPTYIEETASLETKIWVSAGKRGVLMKLAPDDLIKESHAEYADLISLED